MESDEGKHGDDQEGDNGKAGEKAGEDEEAANDLDDGVEIGGEIRHGETDGVEMTGAKVGWKNEFLDAFGKKNTSDHQADEQD